MDPEKIVTLRCRDMPHINASMHHCKTATAKGTEQTAWLEFGDYGTASLAVFMPLAKAREMAAVFNRADAVTHEAAE